MRNRLHTAQNQTARSSRRAAFTLVEILLALSLFLVLLAVVFVPLNNSFLIFNAGRTSIALQGAADSTVKSIATELQGAVAVFPNDHLPGITDRAPYSSTAGTSRAPYFSGSTCTAESARVANTSRIDFILPYRIQQQDVPPKATTDIGDIYTPIKPQRYLVTYYARRFNAVTAPTDPFDRFSNPIGLFRAQMPCVTNADDATITSDDILYTTDIRYSGCSNTKSKWLLQTTPVAFNHPAEPQLGALVADTGDGVPGSDTLVSPRDMGVGVVDPATMQPDLNFLCEDTDGNGIIDRVTISLTLIQYEEGNSGRNGQPAGQRVTATQTVNLLNTKLGV